MTEFVDSLELPIRVANALRANGIETMGQFMALEAREVLQWKNTGRRSWNEIRMVQEDFEYQGSKQQIWNQFVDAVDDLNRRMSRSCQLRVITDSNGLLIPAKIPKRKN